MYIKYKNKYGIGKFSIKMIDKDVVFFKIEVLVFSDNLRFFFNINVKK